MGLLDRFLKALADGDASAEDADRDVRAAYLSDASLEEAEEEGHERITRWAEEKEAQ